MIEELDKQIDEEKRDPLINKIFYEVNRRIIMNLRNHCIIVIVLVLCFIFTISFAEDMCGPNLQWSLSDSGTLTISGTGEMQIGYSNPWKVSKKSITKIIVDEGVTSISDNAFNGCENAIEVSLPQSLLDIGKGAFEKCSNLVKINIPNSITTIKEKTFNACKSLTDISLPGGLISIEASAFCDCKSLEKMYIPGNVTSISVDKVFQKCEYLEEFTIDNNNENYYVDDGVLYSKDKNALLYYPAGKQNALFVVPDGTTQISPYSFYENKYINEITIPGSIKFIGKYAFRYCSNLKSVKLLDGIKIIRLGAFEGCVKLPIIRIPSSVELIEGGAFINCPKLHTIEVADDSSAYSSIDGILFSKDRTVLVAYPGGKKESTYSVPEGVTSIDAYAFDHNKNISEITFPKGLETIGKESFYGCNKIESIVLPESLALVDYNAFESCDNLISVTILNPNTEFDKYGPFRYGNKELVIKGFAGSTTEIHANEEGFGFESITDIDMEEEGNQEWICQECGKKMTEGNFCSGCGAKRP